jgi:hypothetical protein
MHGGGVDHNLWLSGAQTRHNRVQTGKLNVLVIECTNFIALDRKRANYILAKLATGTDHRDLHARPAFRTVVAVVID